MAEVIFHSSDRTLDNKDEMTTTSPKGTIGFGMFPDAPIREEKIEDPLPIPPPLKGHLHMFERVTRAKSKLALSVRASLHALASKAAPRTAENPTLAQASKSVDWTHWQEAIGKELDMLKNMQSYDLILRSQVPKGCQILQSKMDLKTKKDAMGKITKRKARLVALGNLEWETVRDTYAPTVNAKTINLMLALSAQERMILYGLDVTHRASRPTPPQNSRRRGTSMSPQEDPVWTEQGPKGILRRHGHPSPGLRLQALPSRPLSVPQDHRGSQDHLLRPRG
jgi:hypothetical protein